MAFMYFAKVNVNSNIYDLYQEPEKLDAILDHLLVGLDQKQQIKVEKDNCWIKFIGLERDVTKRYVVGRVVKIFEDDIQMYVAEEDDIKPLPTKQLARSVAFFFDLRTERVAFVTGRYFGYQQFCSYFKMLLDAYANEVEFEVFLEKNADQLREKIRLIKKVLRVDIFLVAPNNSRHAFNDLFLTTSEELRETNASKLEQSLSASSRSDGINVEVPSLQRAIEAVADGYGDMTVAGRDPDGTDITITSQKDAPHKRWLHENQRYSIPAIFEFGRAYITELIGIKQGR